MRNIIILRNGAAKIKDRQQPILQPIQPPNQQSIELSFRLECQQSRQQPRATSFERRVSIPALARMERLQSSHGMSELVLSGFREGRPISEINITYELTLTLNVSFATIPDSSTETPTIVAPNILA